jgi:hypothetical protein
MSKVYAIDGITPVMLHGFPGRDTVVGAESTIAALAFVKAEGSIPTRSLEPDRKSIDIPGSVPRSQLKKKHA